MNQAEENALISKIVNDEKAFPLEDHSAEEIVVTVIRLAIRAAYAKGREDAAKVCESLCADYYPHARGPYLDCAAAIRKGE